MEESKQIEIDVQLEFKDFWKVLFWQSLKVFGFMYILVIIITLPILTLYFYNLLTNPGNVKFPFLIIMPLLPLIAVLVSQWSIYSTAKRSIESIKGKIQWVFSNDGFEIFTPIARSENNWESLVKIEEKKGYFLLYPQKNVFMLIPKRSFLVESQIGDFRQLAFEKLGKKAKVKI